MNILFITPYTPSPIRVRALYFLRSLSERGHHVTLLFLSEKEIPSSKLTNLNSLESYGFELPKWKSLFNCLQALPTNLPLQSVYCWNDQLANKIQSILSNQKIDIVHVEHLRGVKYALKIKKNFNVPIVWDSVDSISHLFRQTQNNHPKKYLRWLIKFELQRTEKFEKFLATQFEKVLVTSKKDQDEFLTLSPSSPVEVLTNGVDTDYFSPIPANQRMDNVILISGKMSYHANVNMALFAIQEIMPLVWKKNPNIHLWVVGKDPPSTIQQYSANPKIQITGTVPEILPYLQIATISLAPLNYGAGVQNKVLEAMACGIPVIASPLAVSALNVLTGREVLVANNPQNYADYILNLISNPQMGYQIGNAGREYVEREHSWNLIGQKLENIYQESIQSKL
jgi:glycosyltransferase involved in cell wall biosynthesis